MKHKILIISSVLGLLSACSQSADSAPATLPASSLSTKVALTEQAVLGTSDSLTSMALPTETPLPTETLIPFTSVPSATPTFAPGFTEFAQIRVLSPGPMSSLVSPFNLQVMLISGDSERVQVDLLGEDGRVLQRDLELVTQASSGNFRNFRLSFEIRAVSEAGYIRISTKDDFGRIQALNTMPVLLYSLGSSQINPVGNMIYERITLEGIREGDDVFGGVLNLNGLFWPFNDQPVNFELLLPDGRPVSSRILQFNGIEPESFETTLPYKVTEPTAARLTIRQDNPMLSVSDSDLKRYVYVFTTEVILNP